MRKFLNAGIAIAAGCLSGLVLIGVVVWILTRLLFWPEGRTGALAEGLDSARTMGALIGGVAGLERISRTSAGVTRKVALGLCVWIGLTVFVVYGLTLVLTPFLTAGDLSSTPLPRPLWRYLLAQVVPVWLGGIYLLVLVHRALPATHKKPRWGELGQNVRALFWPRADDDLHDFQIETPLSRVEIAARYGAKYSDFLAIPRAWRQLRGDDAPKIVMRGSLLRIVVNNRAQFEFRGQIEGDETGTSIRGRVSMPLWFQLHSGLWAGGALLFSLLADCLIIFQPVNAQKPFDGVLMAAFFCVMQCFGLLMLRCHALLARHQERLLQEFFERDLQASRLEMKARRWFWPWF